MSKGRRRNAPKDSLDKPAEGTSTDSDSDVDVTVAKASTGGSAAGTGSSASTVAGPSTQSKGNAEGASKGKRKLVPFGKPGKIWCNFCRDHRDHYPVKCGNFVCNRCRKQGHLAIDCTVARVSSCHFCGQEGHTLKLCPNGGSSLSSSRTGTKRPVDSDDGEPHTGQVGSRKVASQGAVSYSSVVAGRSASTGKPASKVAKKDTVTIVDSFLGDMSTVSRGLTDAEYAERCSAIDRSVQAAKDELDRKVKKLTAQF